MDDPQLWLHPAQHQRERDNTRTRREADTVVGRTNLRGIGGGAWVNLTGSLVLYLQGKEKRERA